MSIHKRTSSSGRVTWMVRYREGDRNRSADFETKRDAQAFESQIRLAKRKGDLQRLDVGQARLADFGKVWWNDHVKVGLAEATRQTYKVSWNNHVLPYLGDLALRELTPRVIITWRADLERAGRGQQTIKKAMGVLQSCLQHAVTLGELRSNPVREVKKPTARRTKAVRPVLPTEVEQMREHLLSTGRLRDATVISVLAYAGLRPGEAFALRWDHVRAKTLLIEQSASFGEIKETKTGRIRAVKLLPSLRDDLENWRAGSNANSDGLVFPGADSKSPASREAIKSWSRRAFRSAALAANREDITPYSLRHSFASLLIHEGRSVVEVAQELGHAPTMTLSTYAHVIAELEGDRRSADDLIREARSQLGDERVRAAAERSRSRANARADTRLKR